MRFHQKRKSGVPPLCFSRAPWIPKLRTTVFIAPWGLNKELSEKLRNPGWKTLPQAVSDRLRVAGFQEVTHTFLACQQQNALLENKCEQIDTFNFLRLTE